MGNVIICEWNLFRSDLNYERSYNMISMIVDLLMKLMHFLAAHDTWLVEKLSKEYVNKLQKAKIPLSICLCSRNHVYKLFVEWFLLLYCVSFMRPLIVLCLVTETYHYVSLMETCNYISLREITTLFLMGTYYSIPLMEIYNYGHLMRNYYIVPLMGTYYYVPLMGIY